MGVGLHVQREGCRSVLHDRGGVPSVLHEGHRSVLHDRGGVQREGHRSVLHDRGGVQCIGLYYMTEVYTGKGIGLYAFHDRGGVRV